MNLEIERKFLPAHAAWHPSSETAVSHHIKQGYLTPYTEGENVVRVRISTTAEAEQAVLCIKGTPTQAGTPEVEHKLNLSEAASLMHLSGGRIVEKRRWHIQVDGHLYEVDEFLEKHIGLILIELELSEVNEAVPYPSWVGEEVTDDIRYTNAWLAQNGKP